MNTPVHPTIAALYAAAEVVIDAAERAASVLQAVARTVGHVLSSLGRP